MRKPLLAALTLVTFTSACGFGQSRFNPFNWFGGAEAAAPAEPSVVDAEDPRALALQITDLTVDQMPGGAIIRATAVTETQGWWDAELVAVDKDAPEGKMVYEFRVFPPVAQTDINTPQSRSITAAVYLSDIALQTITSITVQGATNGMTTRR